MENQKCEDSSPANKILSPKQGASTYRLDST
jgi:hypothetical protein